MRRLHWDMFLIWGVILMMAVCGLNWLAATSDDVMVLCCLWEIRSLRRGTGR